MTEPRDAAPRPPADTDDGAGGAREPEASPQRRLVDSISAYEVDPPAPSRAQEESPDA